MKGDGGFFAEHGYLETPSLVQWMATLRGQLRCEHCLAVSRESDIRATIHDNGALLWPAIREIIESDTIIPT